MMRNRIDARNRICPLCMLVFAAALVTGWALSPLAMGAPSRRTPTAKGHAYSTETFEFWNHTLYTEGFAEFPVPGRLKIAENNSPLPKDRVFFTFNQFQNALNSSLTDQFGTTTIRDAGVEKYTVGFEKTFFDGYTSVDVRLPVWRFPSFVYDDGFSAGGGSVVGNLSIIGKAMIFESDMTAFTAGLGLTVPTGGDASFMVDQEVFTVLNQAVHVSPFAAILLAPPAGRFFFQAYVQADTPLNGNTVDFRNITPGVGGETLGILNPQTVLCSDLSLGYWLYDAPGTGGLTGLALITELHHLTALQDTDVVCGTTFTGDNEFRFCNIRNRFDVVLMTVGVHAELNDSGNLWVGTVVPFTDEDNRFFDSELQVQVNLRF